MWRKFNQRYKPIRTFQRWSSGISGALCHILQTRKGNKFSDLYIRHLWPIQKFVISWQIYAKFRGVGSNRTCFITIFQYYDVIFIWSVKYTNGKKKIGNIVFLKVISLFFLNIKTLVLIWWSYGITNPPTLTPRENNFYQIFTCSNLVLQFQDISDRVFSNTFAPSFSL